ncbi:hypothetical protein ROSMUCSMR3_00381 [Roseovarius mucosus]|uniref:DNA primase/polymerase bifunctional N-terminal domain-containing protein n=1 Tax=Roseovarius mucosus TaxID=215743 RepID=A0A1V0RJJ6_9RHOB|nr:bifunctional DNA primase/polymerase [Roseovarius mucosus]ARE81886.1 hypothetical protein ROSMUCSMR3_00381 [Roseovarius mucosus]
MNTNPKSNLPETFRAEMARLIRCGFKLLPLGGGTDGKSPLIAKWAQENLTFKRILGPMHRRGIAMYGIRLADLVVVDCDIDDPALVAKMEARFGSSPVHVKSPRGVHLYYRLQGKPPNLRAEGFPVDLKTGPNAYVAGPHSVRPDGGLYWPLKGVLGIDALPALKTQTGALVAPVSPSAPILKGVRHEELVKFALKMVAHVASVEELKTDLRRLRDGLCENPESMPDSELSEIASWAWRRRLENRIFHCRMSEFRVHRQALDLLRGITGQEDALALYTRLVDLHGHTPGKAFPLSHRAMKEAGHTSLSRERFMTARRLLQRLGLLQLMSKHRAGAKLQTFALAMPLVDLPEIGKIARSEK